MDLYWQHVPVALPTEGLAKINANLLVGNLFDAVCKLNVDVEGGAEACKYPLILLFIDCKAQVLQYEQN